VKIICLTHRETGASAGEQLLISDCQEASVNNCRPNGSPRRRSPRETFREVNPRPRGAIRRRWAVLLCQRRSRAFQLTITSAASRRKHPLESCGRGDLHCPADRVGSATAVTEVRVIPSPTEVAEDQIRVQEKQRCTRASSQFLCELRPKCSPSQLETKIRGLPGRPRGSSHLDDRGHLREFSRRKTISGYGQAHRVMQSATAPPTPTLLRARLSKRHTAIAPEQDPRYFYKGSGSKRSRILYRLPISDLQGDDGRWQANYSGILEASPQRYLNLLLSSQRSGSGVYVRKHANRNWRICPPSISFKNFSSQADTNVPNTNRPAPKSRSASYRPHLRLPRARLSRRAILYR